MKTIAQLAILVVVSHSAHAANATSSRMSANMYSQLPMAFEPNLGQASPEVTFIARGSGYTVFLTPSSAVLSLKNEPHQKAVRMSLTGAAKTPQAVGTDRLPGIVNYYRGADRSKWISGIPTYATVKYPSVYPGVDLVYYGNQGSLEYDFVLQPGSTPNLIGLRFDGVANLRLGTSGDLILKTGRADLRFQKPFIYQTSDSGKKQVAGGYRLLGKNRVGFWLGSYDSSKTVTIDPVLAYSSYLGGTNDDKAYGVAVDPDGNAVITGKTISLNFDWTPGAIDQVNQGGGAYTDAFVAKFNPAGALIYSTYLGGSNDENQNSLELSYQNAQPQVAGIASDNDGNAYITGSTESYDFPATTSGPGWGISQCGTVGNVFVTKLSQFGQVVYSVCVGGNSKEIGHAIAVDSPGDNSPGGRAHVVGSTNSTNFPITYWPPAGGGVSDAFLFVVNPSGTALDISTTFGGDKEDAANGVALDSIGDIWITGKTASQNFPTRDALHPSYIGGDYDMFLVKYGFAGGDETIEFASYFGGTSRDQGYAVSVDVNNNVHVTGYTESSNFRVLPGARQPNYGGAGDAFYTTVRCMPQLGDPPGVCTFSGAQLIQSSFLGGSSTDIGYGIRVDASGNTYVTGVTHSTGFPLKNAYQPTLNQTGTPPFTSDLFVTKINPAGTDYVYSTYLGGHFQDSARGLAIDTFGAAYIAGFSNSINFPVTNGVYQMTNQGAYDAVLVKIY